MRLNSVSQVTNRIKVLLDNDPELGDIWIEGEISNFRRAASGHCYFTLKDDVSELPCVMWRNVAMMVNWLPSQGDLINAHGYVSVYERGGAYQFYADILEPGGVGLLWQEFSRLKVRLEAEGLFDQERKRPLPAWPRCVGVVTSASGAAFRDILHVIESRYPLVRIVLSPAVVQGQQAPEAIVQAINRLNREPDIDVMIVARGGGSLEDLWSFNDEQVVRAIAASRVPVVSGVGHETDLTLTDMVADLRQPTPSAAAAAVVPDGQALKERVRDHIELLAAHMSQRLIALRQKASQQERVLRSYAPRQMVAEKRQRLDDDVERITRVLRHQLTLRNSRLAGQKSKLDAMNPILVLGRGYAIVQSATGRRLLSVRQVGPRDKLCIHIRDGQVDAQVTETRDCT